MMKQLSFFRNWAVKAYLWATELLYHPLAWAYDIVAWLVSFGYWSQWRLDALSYLISGPVLEVGFGTGELLIELNARGWDVTGLELSPQMHRVTQRKLKSNGVHVKRVLGRTEAMPFFDGVFSNIISTFPSNYIVKTGTLNEIHRVLTVGGRLVIVGLGVRFKIKFFRWLTGWFLEDKDALWLRNLTAMAEKMGFKATVVNHDGKTYTLPVLILERENEK